MALPPHIPMLGSPAPYGPVAPVAVPPPLQEGFRLPAHGSSVGVARRRLRTSLPVWGFGDDLCDAAELVLSELFTNALVHTTSTSVGCLLRVEPAWRLYVEVADQGGGPASPIAREAGAEDESGRGLALVRSLARSWGDHRGPDGGWVVWALLGED